jgi:hypothetical protein
MIKGVGSGSVSQRSGSGSAPNVTDPSTLVAASPLHLDV